MTIEYRQDVSESLDSLGTVIAERSRPGHNVLRAGAGPAFAKGDDESPGGRFYSTTASALFNEVKDDSFVAKAKCINVSDEEKRKDCFAEAKAAAAHPAGKVGI